MRFAKPHRMMLLGIVVLLADNILPAGGAFRATLHAQSQGGTAARLDTLFRAFETRAKALTKTCQPVETEKWLKEANESLQQNGKFGNDAEENKIIEAHIYRMDGLASFLFEHCSHERIMYRLRGELLQCKFDNAQNWIARLGWLVQTRRKQLNAAKRAGEFSAVDVKKAQAAFDGAQEALKKAPKEVRNWQEECDKKKKEPVKVGDARTDEEGGLPSEPETPQAENVCYEPAPGPVAEQCGMWAPLLGRLTSAKYGGVIELRLQGDGTLSGYIVSANKVMTDNGFAPGMMILRGWKYGYADRGTWQVAAIEGEAFSPVKPGRKPGEPLGDAKWVKSGVIYVEKEKPAIIRLPAGLESGISNYDPWIRSGTTSPAI